MGLVDVIKRMREKNNENKEAFDTLQKRYLMEKKLVEMQKSSNERELERYEKENREERIKQALEYARKERDQDIKFNHNPLNVKNITKSEWEILKEKNQFSNNKCMFSNQPFIHKTNKSLLKNSNKLFKL